jgi:hypothetical protein
MKDKEIKELVEKILNPDPSGLFIEKTERGTFLFEITYKGKTWLQEFPREECLDGAGLVSLFDLAPHHKEHIKENWKNKNYDA